MDTFQSGKAWPHFISQNVMQSAFVLNTCTCMTVKTVQYNIIHVHLKIHLIQVNVNVLRTSLFKKVTAVTQLWVGRLFSMSLNKTGKKE